VGYREVIALSENSEVCLYVARGSPYAARTHRSCQRNRVGVDGEDVADADLGLLVVEDSGDPKSPAGSPDEAGQCSEVQVVAPFHPGDFRLTDVQLLRHLLLGQPPSSPDGS